MSRVICIIPARYESSRFPGKPLADLCGHPMIEWVYRRSETTRNIEKTFVATDDQRIFDVVEKFGGNAIMTTGDYHSGTDRIADAVKDIPCDIIVNLQGDEPMMHPDTIDSAVSSLRNDSGAHVSTAMIRIREKEDFLSPNVVKVVCSRNGRALYFSRSPVPSLTRADKNASFAGFYGFKHLGLYVYRRESLLSFPEMEQTFLERLEKLEQLRFLENGYNINVIETEYDSTGVDTPGDLEKLKEKIENGSSAI